MSIKTCMILVGGKGTRLQSIVNDRPKPLADINGRPFLDFILDYLLEYKVNSVILLTGYMGKMIENKYGRSYKGLSLRYSLETTPLGTGGAIKNAIINTVNPDDNYLVLNGDTCFAADLTKLKPYYKGKKNVVFSTPSNKAQRYGALCVDFSTKRVLRFLEKNNAFGRSLINAGSYYLCAEDILSIPQSTFSLENDFLPHISGESGNLYYIVDGAPFIDIGIPSDYERFRSLNE
jgi:D-glycero-alpha-D-manno-heptose 1-phosphate guanylyltransferase